MLGTLVVMFIVKWQLALIIVALIPVLVLVSLYFRKKILANYRNVRRINSQITGSFNEGILGGKVLCMTGPIHLMEVVNKLVNYL